MKKRRRIPLRKTYRPWKLPLDPEKIDKISPEEPEQSADDVRWTAEEWERIWRSTSG